MGLGLREVETWVRFAPARVRRARANCRYIFSAALRGHLGLHHDRSALPRIRVRPGRLLGGRPFSLLGEPKMGALTALRYCDLSGTARIIGRKRLLKLIASNAEEERSLRPFIRTNSIFVHVPKAAGVSIARALYGDLGMGHMTLAEYRTVFRQRAFDKMFKFAFVRNPFDRLHSAYHFLRAG